jgi:alpha-amylase
MASFVTATALALSASALACDPSSQRIDCGSVGSEKASCEAQGCCWSPVSPNPDNKPWCFKQSGSPTPPPAPTPPAAPTPAPAPTPHTAAPAFVHLFEWSWTDVATECESWLGPKGFKAVQISPPNEHISGSQWWTRYQPVSYTLESRSGNATQFADMVSRCAKVGVEIYADAVINHMAAGSGTGIAGTTFGGRSFAGLYSADDFHHSGGDTSRNCVVNDYTSKDNVQLCDLDGLPDLCTGCAYVQKTLAGYLQALKSAGVTGVRIDAAKHQDAGEMAGYLKEGGKGLFVFQEVISGSGEAVSPDMYYGNGDVTEFRLATSGVGPNIATDGKLQFLETFGESWGLMPSNDAVVFIDNHDTQRGGAPLTYKDGQLYTFANLFMLSWPYGYPKVMSSYYFSDHDQGPPRTAVHGPGGSLRCADGSNWVCEHRTTAIANMVKWRSSAGGEPVANWKTLSPDQVVFSRGSSAFIALNRDASNKLNDATVQTGMAAGKYCDIIQSDDTKSCPTVLVGADGTASVSVSSLSAVAIHTGARVD